VRNWDYRFCWLRDETLTLLALMNAGYQDEARDWRDWLLRAVAGRSAMPPTASYSSTYSAR
jgi:GH15 family glucan-1,4-alpha-glucosidase